MYKPMSFSSMWSGGRWAPFRNRAVHLLAAWPFWDVSQKSHWHINHSTTCISCSFSKSVALKKKKKTLTLYFIKMNAMAVIEKNSRNWHTHVFCFDVAWLHIVLVCFLQEKPVRPPCGITTPGCISMTTQQRESLPSLSRTSCTPCSLTPASSSCSEIRWKGESNLCFFASSLQLHA